MTPELKGKHASLGLNLSSRVFKVPRGTYDLSGVPMQRLEALGYP